MTTLLHLPFDAEAGLSTALPIDHGVYKAGFSSSKYSESTSYYMNFEAGSGKFGGAAHFSAGWLSTPYASWMDLSGDFTIEGWLYTTLPSDPMILVGRWQDGNGPWRIGLGSDGHMWFDYVDASGATNPATASGTVFVQKSVWTHFAFVRASGGLTVYIGGKKSHTHTVASLKTYAAPSLTIGRLDQNASWHYYGFMDDLRISDAALYTSEFTPPGAIAYTPVAALSVVRPNLPLAKSYFPFPKPDLTRVRKVGVVTDRMVDYYYGGAGVIEGHTYVLSGGSKQPVARRVRLFVQPHGGVIAETWSDAATGYYAFQRLSKDYRYFVMSYDHTGANEAVVGTNIRPV